MGWCYAFGPQIRAGCDHAMVAGRDSCSCAECAAVCRGLFPGCSSVWAAGPRRVSLTRPTKQPGGLLPVRTASAFSPPAAEAVVANGGAVDDSASAAPVDQFETRGLRIDMQLLLWKVEQLRQAAAPAEQMLQAATEIKAAAAALPEQVRGAVSAALEMQRQSILASFADMQRKIVVDIAQVQEMLRRAPGATGAPEAQRAPGGPGATSGRSASVSDLDVRFQWLVDAVSERFVTLGNELARIERQWVDDRVDFSTTTGGPSTNGTHGTHGKTGTNGSGAAAPAAPRAGKAGA